MQLILSFAKPARHFLPHGLAGENERDLHQIMEMNKQECCARGLPFRMMSPH